ncbi:MAG: hypothetical protein AAGA77_19980 [Bacteroidota bacterium]
MNKDYSQQVHIKSSASSAFKALSSEIPNWWGRVDQSAQGLGDIFTITFGNAFWTFKIVEYRLNHLIAWECMDGQPELNNEWKGHLLKWTIKEDAQAIVVGLDQKGLNASLPCYAICSKAWDRFILGSLKDYLETGKGSPGS